MVVGAIIWLALAIGTLAWATVLTFARGTVLSVRAVAQWLLSAWFPRILVLSAWAVAGWHVFCQRP
jgi:hypothetical protein